MRSRMFSQENVDEARRLIDSGISESAVLTQFRIKWSLSQTDAERLYREARRESPTSPRSLMRQEGGEDLVWGFAALLLGGVVSAISWITASPGGTYLLMWGPILYGAYRLFRGFTLKLRASRNRSTVFMWISVAVLLGSGVVIAGTLAVAAGQPDPPPNTDVVWEPNDPVIFDDLIANFTGRVENTNDSWRVENPTLVVQMHNAAGFVVSEHRIKMNFASLPPHQSAEYSVDLTLREAFTSYQPTIEWEWVED